MSKNDNEDKKKIYILSSFWGYIFLMLIFIAVYITGIYFYFGDINELARRVIIVTFTFITVGVLFNLFTIFKVFKGSLVLDDDAIYIKEDVIQKGSLLVQHKFSLRYKKIKSISCCADRADSKGREFKIGIPWKKVDFHFDILHCDNTLYLVLTDVDGKDYRINLLLYYRKDDYRILDEIAKRVKRARGTQYIDEIIRKVKDDIYIKLCDIDEEDDKLWS